MSERTLARRQRYKRIIREDEDENVRSMEFRLTYEGQLFGATQRNPRARHKHELRKYFHPQLKRLWEAHPILRNKEIDGPKVVPDQRVDKLADRFAIGEYNFVPLVTQDLHVNCGLDILFLRPDPPGELLQSGDIDNRLKTLFDAIRRPTEKGQFGGIDEPGEDERPFFCLVEDDSLVTRVSVETDMLLEAVDGRFDDNSARLIISVTLTPYIATWDNVGF